jgi:pyruvate,water dikinase
MSTHPEAGPSPTGPIPPPPNFPVTWDSPDYAQMFWQQERMHFPEPMTPLETDIWKLSFKGFNAGLAGYEMPVSGRWQTINTYLYQAIVPVSGSPEELEARGKRAQENLGAAMGGLAERWHGQWLPEIKGHLAFWEAFDLESATMPALVDHLDETLKRYEQAFVVHFQLAFPMLLPISLFEELYRDLFEGATAFDAYALLEGIDNKTMEGGRALWDLSRTVIASPEVHRIVRDEAPADVLPALEASDEGRAFLAELEAFLQEYGQRGDKWNISSPSWIEDPTPVIKNLKDYIGQRDRDLIAELNALTARREQRVADARERLAGYPQPVVGQFEFFLKAAQEGNFLSEEHAFWIDFRVSHQTRQVFMELGRRLAAAGHLESEDDVFYLHIPELKAAAQALVSGDATDLRDAVAERRATEEVFAKITPPPVLGTPPSGPPPDDPVSRTLMKFFGAPPQPTGDPKLLKGSAGSPGTARGPARIVHSLSEAHTVQAGDILVAPTTAPPWTPIFATVAAVVTDTGGALSHCAVVAREYGIPAVVGVGMATAVLRNGQLIEVDGDTGIIRVV